METLMHTRAFTRRRTLELLRQPWFVAVTLVQPVVWLLLFGALFKKVVEIPGFQGGSYIGFLMPGVVVLLVVQQHLVIVAIVAVMAITVAHLTLCVILPSMRKLTLSVGKTFRKLPIRRAGSACKLAAC